MKPPIPIILATAFLMVGCSGKPSPESGTPASPVEGDPSKDGIPEFVRANNAFGLDLYSHLRKRDGNLFFSPTSVMSGLAMASTGASGATFREIRKVIHDPGGSTPLPVTYAAFLRVLAGGQPARRLKSGESLGSEVRIANALWCQSGYPIVGEVQKTLRDGYGSEITSVDFQGAADEAVRLVDEWVAGRTSGKIRNAIDRTDIGPSTKLILTNTVYFRGTWASPFFDKVTTEEDFRISPTQTARVRMMHRSMERHPYADEKTFQVLELPYADDRFSMVVLLPRAVDGLAALESSLTAEGLAGILSRLKDRDEVIVSFPKFSIQGGFALDAILSELGMPSAFGPSADFSAMTGSKNDLFLSKAIHLATVDVDEKGTEAAAFSGFLSPDAYGEDKPPVFRADHPFLFLIRDRRTGTILFLGRLASPESAPIGKKAG